MEKIVKIRKTQLGDGAVKICIPLTAGSLPELETQLERALEGPCDLVEWRADFFELPDNAPEEGKTILLEALKLLRAKAGDRPLLFTFRTKEEGGERQISPENYRLLNLFAASTAMVDLVDVERNRGEALLRELTEGLHEKGVAVVGSFHDFEGTPSEAEIIEILRQMQGCGVDITKAAVMPKNEADVLTLLQASVKMKLKYGDRPFITMSMGRLGAVSRLAGSLTGSAVTFATVGRASAPGQLEAGLLVKLLQVL